MSSALSILQALAALAITLGLFGLGVWALRRYGPSVVKRLQEARGETRMRIVETLALDTGRTRRLVLVSVDGQERLILLGDGQLLDSPPRPVRAPSARKSPAGNKERTAA